MIESLIKAAFENKASDIFLSAGHVARMKVNGQLMIAGDDPIESEDMIAFWKRCGADPEYDGDRDSSYVAHNGVRFRVNLHRHLGNLGAVLRQINTEIPGIESLGLPVELLTKWVSAPSGLVLITGPTGSGKSTTLASSLEWLNQNSSKHIVTIEDPIEYLFESKKSLFTQREVHTDTDSFARGLRSSLRQAPDVILLGEIRDPETAKIALQAAETGHLVLATLHSANVSETIERLTNLFPSQDRESQLQLLSNLLIGICCQVLLPSAYGGLHLVTEHLENTGVIRNYVRESRIPEIVDFIGRGDNPNNKLFMDALVEATQKGHLTQEEAATASGNESDFDRAMRGIS
ncbi:PilT/PilU family type 4a pilus ATPase [Verrucomicrobia bacterium]|nr:PilT/PilU family type 4a pilus ATPase [Verrucomicrobiota bacterium]|tara:strand:+ start:1621 stop:2664 length:1044 start_codon:yes stop_codon:yes gene_type:complete